MELETTPLIAPAIYGDGLSPFVERFALFGRVDRAIVNPGDARPMAGNMVQDRFDDMRQRALVAEPCRDRPANVVQAPGG